MNTLTLVIGNKNYSSWSLRPWLLLKQAGIPFSEIVIPLYQKDSDAKILEHSPAGKVPILKDGDRTVWDSLAIAEYLNERFPDRGLWPREEGARAMARSISAEMHSGFMDLRNECPMNVRRKPSQIVLGDGAHEDIRRIQEIWTECRSKSGKDGPFLFGKFSIADALYAPVVFRFTRYAIPMNEASQAYADTVLALPAIKEWIDQAVLEPWVLKSDEK
ncbi:MAG TPA: glutathione S-transferase family protein [bacterium]|nr:glutathione S-transferase family protein [bacterium]